jgi:hypothetical protein
MDSVSIDGRFRMTEVFVAAFSCGPRDDGATGERFIRIEGVGDHIVMVGVGAEVVRIARPVTGRCQESR